MIGRTKFLPLVFFLWPCGWFCVLLITKGMRLWRGGKGASYLDSYFALFERYPSNVVDVSEPVKPMHKGKQLAEKISRRSTTPTIC